MRGAAAQVKLSIITRVFDASTVVAVAVTSTLATPNIRYTNRYLLLAWVPPTSDASDQRDSQMLRKMLSACAATRGGGY